MLSVRGYINLLAILLAQGDIQEPFALWVFSSFLEKKLRKIVRKPGL
jgi:hypothetical protein